jgi:glycosyltransferase involved in cell wall biosynthesis
MLFVTRDTWPPSRVDLIELFSRHLKKSLALTWLMPREHAGPNQIIDSDQDEVFILSQKQQGGVRAKITTALSYFVTSVDLAVQVAMRRYDAVQVRDAALSALLFLIAARISNTTFIYWMSFPMVEGFVHRAVSAPPGASIFKRAMQWIYGKCGAWILYWIIMPDSDHVFVQSDRMETDVLAINGRLKGRITPIPMGVSTETYNTSNIPVAADDRLNGRRVLLYLGSMDKIRDLGVLVEATAKIAAKYPDICLLLVGERSEDEETSLRETAKRCGIGELLIFTGRLPLTEALSYVRAASVCVSPIPLIDILLPASPTKLIEYLAMARPVVANDHPDQAKVIAESRAGLCVPYTRDAFAAAISCLLDDVPAAEQMGARGPEWVRLNRDYKALSGRVGEVYSRIIPGFGSQRENAL